MELKRPITGKTPILRYFEKNIQTLIEGGLWEKPPLISYCPFCKNELFTENDNCSKKENHI